MKTIIGSIAGVACLVSVAACHHDETPTRTPSQETTTTTSYSPPTQPPVQSTYMQAPPHESASSSYQQEPAQPGAQSSTENQIQPSPATPTAPPIDPSLNNDDQGMKTQPGPVNAKQDKKSPNGAAVTDQGNRKDEVKISARIRKAMVASKTLSFGAKNAKVITSGSKVTLRGTVKSEAEHNEIVGIAKNTDGVSEVEDQLQVKP